MSSLRQVVYIEDHPENFSLVRKALESTGRFSVLEATTGAAGLELVRSRRPAVVLLDLDLPDIDGIEVARRLQADPETETIPIVVITASVMKQEREDALRAGCIAFIEKPFDIARLRAMVDYAIDGTEPPSGLH